MPDPDTTTPGAPCWVELFTSDPAAASAFYGELFGWEAEEPNEMFGGYFNFSKEAKLVAGGMRNDGSQGAPDGWSVYLRTADAKAVDADAVANGGQVRVPPMDVSDLGTMVLLIDAGGASIGGWKPGVHTGFGVTGEHGTPSWFELHTREYEASIAFYENVFHWTTSVVSDSPEFRYTILGASESQALAGVMDASAYLPEGVPSAWSVYFGVDDTDAAVAKAVELGGTVVEAPEDTPYGRLAKVADPTGAAFKLVAPNEQMPAK